MQTCPCKSMIEHLKKVMVPGARIELLEDLDDPYAPLQAGLRGTVEGWDDANNLHVRWDNKSGLSLIPEEDYFQLLPRDELIKEQILMVRGTGRTNMFDLQQVQIIANEKEFFDLVIFIEEERQKYVRFILTGQFTEE